VRERVTEPGAVRGYQGRQEEMHVGHRLVGVDAVPLTSDGPDKCGVGLRRVPYECRWGYVGVWRYMVTPGVVMSASDDVKG
jgi:hypothetical protein